MPNPRPFGTRLLIVEDDNVTREAFATILSREGYQVLTAANGFQALDVLRENPLPALILLDLMMPGMDGYGFRSALRCEERLARIPVVVCSAAGDLRDQARLDVRAVLTKPIDIPTLLDAVRCYC